MSKYEIFLSLDSATEHIINIVAKCEIVNFDNFMMKYKDIQPPENSFFFRQRYMSNENIFVPDLSVSCYCQKIFNPDVPFLQCKNCSEYIHYECFCKIVDKNCPSCKKMVKDLKNPQAIGFNYDDTKNILSMKRLRNVFHIM